MNDPGLDGQSDPAEEDLARPTFRPRTRARRVTGLLLLAALAGTALLAWRAYEDRARAELQDDLVLLAIAAVLTLVLWAARASTSVTHVEMESGRLSVTRNGDTWRCDLAGRGTAVEVVGTPGRRGWKVLFPGPGRSPHVVDASMVDPVHFTRVLAHYRPDATGPP